MGFRYGRSAPWVLREVSFTLPPGRVTEITGPNGAGKSTLLQLIGGMLHPTRGRIVGRPGVAGFAPERFPADQPFTVFAYLLMMARIRRLPEVRARAAILRWAERLGFERFLYTRLPDLSKGSAQKVGLAQALLADPGLLLLDEPFAGLDPETRAVLPPLLAELASAGTTVVLSDHQGMLSHLPDIDRLRVDGTSVVAASAHTEYSVIEIVVPADQADQTAQDLAAHGYTVRGIHARLKASDAERGLR